MYAITKGGKPVSGCDGPAFEGAEVPKGLQAELACVWNSYADPNNNEELWATVWREDNEGGQCAGLPQADWMRLALELRQKHSPDVRGMGECLCTCLDVSGPDADTLPARGSARESCLMRPLPLPAAAVCRLRCRASCSR